MAVTGSLTESLLARMILEKDGFELLAKFSLTIISPASSSKPAEATNSNAISE